MACRVCTMHAPFVAPTPVHPSFKFLRMLRYIARQSHAKAGLAPVAGAAFLANAGPREGMPKHRWFAEQRSLWHSARVFWWMLRRPVHDAGLVREMFFSDDLPEEHFRRCASERSLLLIYLDSLCARICSHDLPEEHFQKYASRRTLLPFYLVLHSSGNCCGGQCKTWPSCARCYSRTICQRSTSSGPLAALRVFGTSLSWCSISNASCTVAAEAGAVIQAFAERAASLLLKTKPWILRPDTRVCCPEQVPQLNHAEQSCASCPSYL